MTSDITALKTDAIIPESYVIYYVNLAQMFTPGLP